MSTEQIVMALVGLLLVLFQLLFSMILMRLWKAIDDNTTATNNLSVILPERYATKAEVIRHHDEDTVGFRRVDTEISSIRGVAQRLAEKVAVLDGKSVRG